LGDVNKDDLTAAAGLKRPLYSAPSTRAALSLDKSSRPRLRAFLERAGLPIRSRARAHDHQPHAAGAELDCTVRVLPPAFLHPCLGRRETARGGEAGHSSPQPPADVAKCGLDSDGEWSAYEVPLLRRLVDHLVFQFTPLFVGRAEQVGWGDETRHRRTRWPDQRSSVKTSNQSKSTTCHLSRCSRVFDHLRRCHMNR